MILHVTDLHCNERWFEWLAGASSRYSLVCMTGDLLNLNPYRAHHGQPDKVLSFLRRLKTPLALVSGNHDSMQGAGPRLENAQWMREACLGRVYADGDSFMHSGLLFRCLAWRGRLPTPGPNEVWLHHAPPSLAGTSISRGGCDFGDFDLGEQMREGRGPRLVLSGHVHDPVRMADSVGGSWSLNPGFAGNSPVPNYFEVDLGKGIAAHSRASGGGATVRLWQPLKIIENDRQ